MKLCEYVKLKGIRSVRALAQFAGVQPNTINNWWNSNKIELLDATIERYLEAQK